MNTDMIYLYQKGREKPSKKKGIHTMKRFRIEHKHSGALSVIAGRDLYDAFRRCGKDPKFWKLVEEF